MSGWNGGYSSGSGEREPSEERGQAAWGPGPGTPPPWASAETRTSYTPQPQPQPQPQQPPPTYVTPPPSPPAPRRFLVILTALAVLGAGIGAGVWFVTREGSTGVGATPGTGVAVTTSRPPASPSESPTPLSGYRRVQDPVGYTIDVPSNWIRRQKQGEKAPVVFYDAPDDGRQLQIFLVTEEEGPADSLRKAETESGYGFVHLPGYQALERDESDTWSELTYRYDDEDKGPRVVIDHRFVAPGGAYYAIRSSGPEDLPLAEIREPLTMALGSFCPVGADCG